MAGSGTLVDSSGTPQAPDYDLPDTFELDRPEHYHALFEDTRLKIVDLVLERAATITELAEALARPKGTIGHHVGVLEEAGLIRVVRTKKVRAIEAKYYGRTGRTYLFSKEPATGVGLAPNMFLTNAAAEFAASAAIDLPDKVQMSTLRYARIPEHRAKEWGDRLADLAHEFTGEARSGDVTYGLLVALYPTSRAHLPDVESTT